MGRAPWICWVNSFHILDLITSIEIRRGNDVNSVFLDVSKEFDKVWHKGLLRKRYSIGVRGKVLNWFESYLSQRRQTN